MRDQRGLAVVGAFAVGAQRFGQRVAQALFVRAALRRRNGVAIGMHERIDLRRPCHGPFRPRLCRRGFPCGRKTARCVTVRVVADFAVEEIEQPPGNFSVSSAGRFAFDQRRIAFPADLDAAKQIGLGPRHAIKLRGREMRVLAENLRVGIERHDGAAPVHRADVLQLADGLAALEAHLVAVAVARDVDFHPFRQRIHHRRADAMQAAGRVIDLAAELSAGMQRGHDDFERRLVLELGMRVDRDAAAVVARWSARRRPRSSISMRVA